MFFAPPSALERVMFESMLASLTPASKPPAVPKFRITKCGDMRTVGAWAEMGSRNERPVYKKVANSKMNMYWAAGSEEWRLFSEDDRDSPTLYRSRQNTQTVPMVGWEVAEGQGPAPKVHRVIAFEVTDCGVASLEGAWEPSGFMNGKPSYKRVGDADAILYWNEAGDWRFYRSDREGTPTLFSCPGISADVPLTGWRVARGSAPPPTLARVIPGGLERGQPVRATKDLTITQTNGQKIVIARKGDHAVVKGPSSKSPAERLLVEWRERRDGRTGDVNVLPEEVELAVWECSQCGEYNKVERPTCNNCGQAMQNASDDDDEEDSDEESDEGESDEGSDIEERKREFERRLLAAVRQVDADGDGFLSEDELRKVMAVVMDLQDSEGDVEASEFLRDSPFGGDFTDGEAFVRTLMHGDKYQPRPKPEQRPTTGRRIWKVGDAALYRSTSLNQWLRCQVIDVDTRSYVRVDCKKDFWLTFAEQATLLKAPPSPAPSKSMPVLPKASPVTAASSAASSSGPAPVAAATAPPATSKAPCASAPAAPSAGAKATGYAGSQACSTPKAPPVSARSPPEELRLPVEEESKQQQMQARTPGTASTATPASGADGAQAEYGAGPVPRRLSLDSQSPSSTLREPPPSPLAASLSEQDSMRLLEKVTIIMSTPEHGPNGEPIMQNLLYIAQKSNGNYVSAFDRRSDEGFSFAGDEELFRKGEYMRTSWADAYRGRAAATSSVVIAANPTCKKLNFLCIDGGPISQWEQEVVRKSDFREAIKGEVQKHSLNARITINTEVMDYESFCRDVDSNSLFGVGRPLAYDLRMYRFDAVIEEAVKLPTTISTLNDSIATAMREKRSKDSRWMNGKRKQIHRLMALLDKHAALNDECFVHGEPKEDISDEILATLEDVEDGITKMKEAIFSDHSDIPSDIPA